MAEKLIYYLTKEGLSVIKKEREELEILKLAKTKGDLSKILYAKDLKPEYAVFREDINFLEVRLAELNNIIKNAKLISVPPKNKQNVIDLGATILVSVDGQDDEFTLVGHLEANPSFGKISNESPVGSALLGRKAGDRVVISSPARTVYKIKKIKYERTS